MRRSGIMALINCPECKNKVSDKAEICPHCGYKLPKPKPMFQGVYCPSCLDSSIKIDIDICPFCHIKYKDSIYGTFDDVYKYGENHPELKRSPEFSQEAYNKRINYVPGDYISVNKVTCPYCKSTNTKKITTTSKVVNTAMFGIFGQKRKHQWHCNNCKSDF